ncbi:MAG: AI-2E family transporter, partial [Actinomycetota bacterium]|nr:AI-2E family transporter [Actinomycetota bacterium]
MTREDTVKRYKEIAIVTWAIFGVILLFASLFFLISKIRSIFPLIVFTIAIVYILRPIVNFFESKGVSRLQAVIITYLIMILVIAPILFYFSLIIAAQVRELINNLPGYVKALMQFVERYRGALERFQIPPAARGLFEEYLEKVKRVGMEIFSRIPRVTMDIFSLILHLILAPLMAFYILKDLRMIKATMSGLIPQKYRMEAFEIIHKVDVVLGGFLRGQLLVALAVGVLCGIALTILRVDFAIVLGVIAGVLNIIPYFGPIAGGALAAMVALIKSPTLAVLVIIAMIIIQLIDGMLLSPNIISRQVNLHPVVVIFSLLIGAALFGIMGMILAIPIAAAGKALV